MSFQSILFIFTSALIFFAVVFNGEVSVNKTQTPILLGNMTYEYGQLIAPVATGPMLTFQSWVLTSSPLGPFLRRVLLNDNNLHILRELAKQIPYVQPLHYPMRRLSINDHNQHTSAADKGQNDINTVFNYDGITSSDNTEGSNNNMNSFSESRVMAFHKTYLEAASSSSNSKNTPYLVIGKILNALHEGGLQEKYKIFVSIDHKDILEQAKASEKRYHEGKPLSILDGVPIGVKDMIDVLGHVMKDGSASHDDEVAALQDDPIVANFRKLGAIIMGTTTMTEGGVTPLGYCAAEKVSEKNRFDI